MRNTWDGKIGKAATRKVALTIASRDGLTWRASARKALAWARRTSQPAAPADRYAAMRARGVFSPRDTSAAANAHFRALRCDAGGAQHWGGR